MNRSTLRTKSFWTGLAIIVTGIGMIALGQTAEGLQTIAGGIATIFVRDAITKVQSGTEGAASPAAPSK
jgi:hypothetical protein